MQLKLKRTQREGGVLSKSVIFCLDARVEFTAQEKASITRYKLQNQVIYNSEASKRNLDRSDALLAQNTIGSNLKSLAFTALAGMSLNISIGSLQNGQHIECKSLDELLGAEEAIMTACQNTKAYLDTASTFDGQEVLIDFATGQPELIATATTPTPMLIAPHITPLAMSDPEPGLITGALPPPMGALDGLPPPMPPPTPLPEAEPEPPAEAPMFAPIRVTNKRREW